MRLIINCTPHPVDVLHDGRVHTFEPSGQVARVVFRTRTVAWADGLPIVTRDAPYIVGLPEPRRGTYYIVSRDVAMYCDRPDILVPDRKRYTRGGYLCERLLAPHAYRTLWTYRTEVAK